MTISWDELKQGIPYGSKFSAELAKPTAEFMMVTPDMARRWLGCNTHNRRVKLGAVRKYAGDMAADRWLITGEAIQFDVNDTLLDGQNRLLAIVKTGVTLMVLVVRGLQPEAQDVMDSGVGRTASDALTLHGYSNTNIMASAAKWCVLWDEDRLYGDTTLHMVSHSQVMAYAEGNESLELAVARAKSLTSRIQLQPSILAVMIYLTSRVHAEDSAEFFGRAGDGVGLPAGSPILALLSRLRAIKEGKVRVEPTALMSIVIRTWNAYRQHEQMTRVQVYREGKPIRCPQPK